MWHKTNSDDWSLVGENISLGQRVEAGTRLVPHEARRQFDVWRPSPLASVCTHRPDPRQAGGVDALVTSPPQRGGEGHRPEHVLAILLTTGFDL